MKRRKLRILVIADVLAESPIYAGRHRVEGLCRAWAGLGHDVHIVTRGPAVPRIVDGCTYHLTPSWLRSVWLAFPKVHRFQTRVRSRVLRKVLIPDKEALWYRRAHREGSRVLATGPRFDFIFSSFSSATSHLVAARLAEATGIPWIADYRDIWTDNTYHRKDRIPFYLFGNHTQRARPVWRLSSALERRCLAHAACITTISEPLAEILRQKVGPSVPVYVVPNGYDPAQVPASQSAPPGFDISYTGRLNNSADWRELRTFLDVLAELSREIPGAAQLLRFRYFGWQHSTVRTLSEQAGVSSLIEARPSISFEDSIAVHRSSAILLLMLPLDERTSIGASSRKLFDYLAARRPIVGFVPRSSDAALIISKTGAGSVASDHDELKNVLRHYALEFRDTGQVAYHGRPDALHAYDFSALGAMMLQHVQNGRLSPFQDGA